MTAERVPSRMTCCKCGSLIPAGSGRYVVEGGDVRFVHSGGACPKSAGAVPGSGVVWGEIPALVARLWEHQGVPVAEAAEAVRWKDADEGGRKP